MDMAEIRFEALARKMAQGDECFPLAASVLEDIALHLGVAAAVAVFIAKATKRLRRCVPLFGRRGLVVQKDLVDRAVKWSEDRGLSARGTGNGVRLRVPQDLADRVSRTIKFESESLDGHAIAMGAPNSTVFVHRKHSLASVRVSASMTECSL